MNKSNFCITLIGHPNCGKSSLFNRLTGNNQKVSNYPGVTVDYTSGNIITSSGYLAELIDLPGIYSLNPITPDESLTCDFLLKKHFSKKIPNLIICVISAKNISFNIRFILEIKKLGYPMILVLNMMDQAIKSGIKINIKKLTESLDIKIIKTIAIKNDGFNNLINAIDFILNKNIKNTDFFNKKENKKFDIYTNSKDLLSSSVVISSYKRNSTDEIIDKILLHPVGGLLLLIMIMFFSFQGVYILSYPFTNIINYVFLCFNLFISKFLEEGPFRSLLLDAVIGGIGNIVGFFPQILILFLFLMIIEQSGYLPRIVFLLDRIMMSFGLTGRSVIPLLSSFACAIPGIIGTRIITNPRDRIITVLIAPLITCSARLSVYALLIGAFIPGKMVLGIFNLRGIVLFLLYMIGIIGAMLVGWVMKNVEKNNNENILLMEIPSYSLPKIYDLAIGLWKRFISFFKRLGATILALTILIWFISTFPLPPVNHINPAIYYTFAGYIGRGLEYIFSPIGFNWQISIALIPAFAARETAISALATIYNISGTTKNSIIEFNSTLSSNFSIASALSLLIWFAYAPQCILTLAVIRQETKSWKNTIISFSYMFIMAYTASLLTYQVSLLLFE